MGGGRTTKRKLKEPNGIKRAEFITPLLKGEKLKLTAFTYRDKRPKGCFSLMKGL